MTRPEPGLSETLRAVEALGWEALACPMLEVTHFRPLSSGAFSYPVRAVLLTSANALPALRDWPRHTPIVAVGPSTAARAREAGFEVVDAAAGDARALEDFCRTHGLTGRDVVLLCGETYGEDLAISLDVTRVEVYAARKRDRLPREAGLAIRRGWVEAVLFYSGKTADAFCEALKKETLADPQIMGLAEVRALCLSDAIAARLDARDWRSVEGSDPLARLGPCR